MTHIYDSKEYDKSILNLRKDILKYEESVNKCNIFDTNVLAEVIGINFIHMTLEDANTTTEQKREIKILENQFSKNMERLKHCACIKKIEK